MKAAESWPKLRVERRPPESNRCKRLCRPLRSHSARAPGGSRKGRWSTGRASGRGLPNIYDPEFDVERDEAPYIWKRARLGRAAGSERLGASLFSLPPGAATFPLHAHLHNEELLVVVSGTPTLRTLADPPERTLAAGDVVAFPAGLTGAHELRNDSASPVSLLIVSTMAAPEINVFPDTGELWIRDYIPGTDPPTNAFDVHTSLPPTG